MTTNHTLTLILFLVMLAIMALWAIIYMNRRRLVRWICLRKAARKNYPAVYEILSEARKEHMISFDDEARILDELGLSKDQMLPAACDVRPNVMQHLKELVLFYLPRK